MTIEDYAGKRIRMRGTVTEVGHRSGRWSAEKVLILEEVYHAETGDLLGRHRTAVYPKSERRDEIGPGSYIEFEAKVSRPKGEDYYAIVDASDFRLA